MWGVWVGVGVGGSGLSQDSWNALVEHKTLIISTAAHEALIKGALSRLKYHIL